MTRRARHWLGGQARRRDGCSNARQYRNFRRYTIQPTLIPTEKMKNDHASKITLYTYILVFRSDRDRVIENDDETNKMMRSDETNE